MSRTFISYRRNDAGRGFDPLRNPFAEQDLFFDQDAIEPGDHFPNRIKAEIQSPAFVPVVIGPEWLECLNEPAASKKIDFVQQEVSIAVEREGTTDDRNYVIPILVGEAPIPKPDRLNDNLRDPIGPLFDSPSGYSSSAPAPYDQAQLFDWYDSTSRPV